MNISSQRVAEVAKAVFGRSIIQLVLFMAMPLVLIFEEAGCAADEQMNAFTTLSNAEAWKRLPSAQQGNQSVLPTWARTLAAVVPKSAAALLELDYAQRTASPVLTELRAAMRWVIADTNQCEYSRRAAHLDLTTSGASASRLTGLITHDWSAWSKAEQSALRFAQQMSRASNSISDEQFESLVKDFGQHQAASMVLLCAYGNMQDRLLVCVGADVEVDESSGALAPLKIAFDSSSFAGPQQHPKVNEPLDLQQPDKDSIDDDGNWGAIAYEDLQHRLQYQRDRKTRLPVPEWNEIESKVPVGLFSKPTQITWYRIVFGYAPELALPFERFMRTAGAETGSRYGRVFGTSLFWVVTRAMECSYCMGHCEMNWEVAGLDAGQIASRSQALASADWSAFPVEQQVAFAFARKLSQYPEQVSAADLEQLKKSLGADLALISAMHACRYHYMTRISNGFQLQLESENVFFDYWNKSRDAQGDKRPPNAGAGVVSDDAAYVTLLSSEAAWAKLPALSQGDKSELPSWARAVATQLPRTAAAMLELDAAHRLRSPIPPALRAELRWVIAKENRCQYSQATALADLKRVAGPQATLLSSSELEGQGSGEHADAIEFMRQLTKSAATLPDERFARVRAKYGDQITAAMVQLAAYGNFQDRIVLGLNLPLEEHGALAPIDVRFASEGLQRAPHIPNNNGTDTYESERKAVVQRDNSWTQVSYDQLQERLEAQRNRQPRLPIPSWEDVKGNLPEEMAKKPTRIVWSLINYGYSPELAIAWTTVTRTHWAEKPASRILEESLFWVQTRTIECNYCMGHCEMLLESAGLSKADIEKRTRLLADTDWSAFPAEEQRAYEFARKLSLTPWDIKQADYAALQQDFGDQQAMSIFWWLCRGLYMTRISDGFQLPLERENVFQ